MLFEVRTSGSFYRDNQKEKLEKLGFKFTKDEEAATMFNAGWYKDYQVKPTIEINTLEELMRFITQWGELVISQGRIEIYDDYRE